MYIHMDGHRDWLYYVDSGVDLIITILIILTLIMWFTGECSDTPAG